jgi:hypothetical protein
VALRRKAHALLEAAELGENLDRQVEMGQEGARSHTTEVLANSLMRMKKSCTLPFWLDAQDPHSHSNHLITPHGLEVD